MCERPLGDTLRDRAHNHLKSLFLPYTNCTTQRISVYYEIVKVIGSFNLQTTSTEKKALHFNVKEKKNTIQFHIILISFHKKAFHDTKHQILTGGEKNKYYSQNFLSKQCVVEELNFRNYK